MRSPILVTGSRFLIALLLVFSLYVLLRGHNAPGGGFIGGLIAASGFALHAFASGVAEARRALKVDPRSLGIAGMLAALLSGVVPALVGQAPFGGVWFELGGYALSNIILFDIGVYLAVVGGVLTLIFALEETV